MPPPRRKERAENLAPVRLIDGVAVVSDEPVFTTRGHHEIPGRRLLMLANGTQVYACADCDQVGSHTSVAIHRAKSHGDRGPARSAPAVPKIPDNIQEMTLGDVLHLAAGIKDWQRIFDMQEEQIATLTERATSAERQVRAYERMFAKMGFQRIPEPEPEEEG